jgi:CheY-like chemotaxis protein
MAQSQNNGNKREHFVLIVEDSPVDFEIISRAFKRVEFSPKIHRCEDGDQALNFLVSSIARDSMTGKPLLVLLDLNLPGTDGREVLSTMKSDRIMNQIPVIVLSTSNNENDIEFCFSVGADKYLKKPISADEFAETALTIKKFWEDQIISHGSAYQYQ